MEKLLVKIATILGFVVVWVFGVALVIAALLVLDAPLPAKILIGVGFGFLALMFYRIDAFETNVLRLLSQSAYFSRVSFIAAETNRTNPSDVRATRDIAAEDIANENETQKIEKELSGGFEANLVIYGGYILVTAIATLILLNLLKNYA